GGRWHARLWPTRPAPGRRAVSTHRPGGRTVRVGAPWSAHQRRAEWLWFARARVVGPRVSGAFAFRRSGDLADAAAGIPGAQLRESQAVGRSVPVAAQRGRSARTVDLARRSDRAVSGRK